MAQLDRLIRDARKSMKARGHVPMPAQRWHESSTHCGGATIDCAKCDKTALVLCRPLPNEINIGGAAIGESCHVATSKSLDGFLDDRDDEEQIRLDAVMGC